MKEYFIKTLRGQQFEFRRVSSSSFDRWYHIGTTIGSTNTNYRMHDNKEGVWKIMSKRTPNYITDLESEFNEVILGNEQALSGS